jgi:hypothetical protein
MILTGDLGQIWASCGGACWRLRRLRAGQRSANDVIALDYADNAAGFEIKPRSSHHLL